jgi:hypothetical protein
MREIVRKASKVVGCVWGIGARSGDGRNKLNGREECRILTECWREKKNNTEKILPVKKWED